MKEEQIQLQRLRNNGKHRSTRRNGRSREFFQKIKASYEIGRLWLSPHWVYNSFLGE